MITVLVMIRAREWEVLLWGFPMQGQFLVSIGSRDIHNHILDIKNKEKNLKKHSYRHDGKYQNNNSRLAWLSLQDCCLNLLNSSSHIQLSANLPFQSRELVCPDSHTEASQQPLTRWLYPKWRCWEKEQMNSTHLAQENPIPANTKHKHINIKICLTWWCHIYWNFGAKKRMGRWRLFHVTSRINPGISMDNSVLNSSWNHNPNMRLNN